MQIFYKIQCCIRDELFLQRALYACSATLLILLLLHWQSNLKCPSTVAMNRLYRETFFSTWNTPFFWSKFTDTCIIFKLVIREITGSSEGCPDRTAFSHELIHMPHFSMQVQIGTSVQRKHDAHVSEYPLSHK